MTQTIEAFINRLQADGVQAGQEAAQKIVDEARQQAEALLADARVRAERLLDETRAECQQIRLRSETELRLSARDTVGRLHETLNRALRTVLAPAVREQLDDPQFLASLIREMVSRYAQADAGGRNAIVINVPETMQRQLTAWVLEAFHGDGWNGPSVELRGILAEAGFECRLVDGTIEVTAESVVETLADMVSPALWKRISEADGLGGTEDDKPVSVLSGTA